MAKRPKTVFDTLRTKSWKREVSVGLFSVLVYFFNYTIRTEDVALLEARMRVLDLIVYPIFLFAAAAYGMHSFTAQYLPTKSQTKRLEKLPQEPDETVVLEPPAEDLKNRGL